MTDVGDSFDIVDKINVLSPNITICHHKFSLFTIQNKLQVSQPCHGPCGLIINVGIWLRTVSTTSMLVTNTCDKDTCDKFVTKTLT